METFQHRLIRFDEITADMEIPEAKRELTLTNVQWMVRNLHFRNSKHPQFGEAAAMLKTFALDLRKK